MSVASPSAWAFPEQQSGRHPQVPFRGLLRLHARYGPLDRSAAQGDLCHEASIRLVAQPNRSSATRSTDNSLGGTSLHWRYAPSGRTAVEKVGRRRRARNNRIEEVCHSNQGCVLAWPFESKLRSGTLKIFFQHYRSIGDTNLRGRHGRTCSKTGRQRSQLACGSLSHRSTGAAA